MLVELSITDFVIIASLRIHLGPGFGVLTGETGTGKSIIVDAVALLLGGRASVDVIRAGAKMAEIEGVFAMSEATAQRVTPILVENGLAEDDEMPTEVILRREITRHRRSACRVNGRSVTLATLRSIGRHLVDIHGQGEQLTLMRTRYHIDALDRFGGLMAQRRALGDVVRQLHRVQQELGALRRDEREIARQVDLLSYQVGEIEAAALQVGEIATLERERDLLANAEDMIEHASQVYGLLTGDSDSEVSIIDLLGAVAEHMSALAAVDDTLSESNEQVESLLYQLEDLMRMIRDYREQIEYDPKRLAAVEERLGLIRSLQLKYGDTIPDILAYAREAQEKLDHIEQSDEREKELTAEKGRLRASIAAQGQALGAARRETAARLEQRIEVELADLSMERAQFLVDIRWHEAEDGLEIDGKSYAFDPTGIDRVEFLIAPNPGEEPKPLARIASGGETSRLMLAMKTALSDIDPVPTLIFDEIDAGIGGRTGDIVGRKLWTLAQQHQVFCVTHLAQLACYGNQHFRVDKQVIEGDRTVSSVVELEPKERVEEIAVMLGGTPTELTLKSAQEMLDRVAVIAQGD